MLKIYIKEIKKKTRDRKNLHICYRVEAIGYCGSRCGDGDSIYGSVWGDGVVTASAATAKVKIDKKAFPDSKFRQQDNQT